MEIRRLKCSLSQEELATKRRELERALDAQDESEAKAAALKADAKRLQAEAELVVSRLRVEIREVAEYRPVEVSTTEDYRRGQATTVRLDTGEVIESRALTAAERQQELPAVRSEEEILDDIVEQATVAGLRDVERAGRRGRGRARP